MTATTPSALQRSADPLLTVLTAAGRAGVPVLLWGQPGIGKSSLINAVADSEGLPIETVLTSVREPSDFAGLPVVADDGSVTMAPPSWARTLAEADDGGILFLDELSTAPPATQAAVLRVVLDRVVGDLPLGGDVRVIAAANPPEHAADGWDLSAPLANRFLHIDHTPDTDAWLSGIVTGFPTPTIGRVAEPSPERTARARAEIAAFVRTRRDLAQRMPDQAAATGRPWPSFRTWTMSADVLALLDPHDTAAVLMAVTGLVGEGPATEYMAWRLNNDLPDPADVIDNPADVAWPELDPSRTWAVLTGAISYATAQHTKTAWNAAWTVLAHAADHGHADVAAACSRTLLTARPAGATPPASARRLTKVLTDAGILTPA